MRAPSAIMRKLGPHDRRVDAPRERTLREAAVARRIDVFLANNVCKLDQPVSNQFRMLDDVGGSG